jgi:hypothetical protein
MLEKSQASWTASKTDGSSLGKAAHLCISRWVNPYPALQIRHIDFVSLMTQSSPFLVAVTAEPVRGSDPLNSAEGKNN